MSRDTTVHVWSDVGGSAELVGTAWISQRREIRSTFAYAPSWQANPSAFAISPELDLSTAQHHVSGLPGAVADSAPDRWGRNLVAKQLRAQMTATGNAPRQIGELDYLLGVSDLTRQGALRFTTELFTAEQDGEFLAPGTAIPPLIELPRLLHAADAVGTEDSLSAVKELLDAGTGSLGGARPKASVRDGDQLAIAKFPHPSDEWDVMAWETTALDLAERAGIGVPTRQLVKIDHRHALVLDRFDRTGAARLPYISAMTLVGGVDGERYDYLDVVEALTEHGGNVGPDLNQLWRRIAFSLLVNNTDDHLRNHGFLHGRGGWRLSPAFDINPNPQVGGQSQTTIAFAQGGRSERLAALLAAAEVFGLSGSNSSTVIAEVTDAVAGWRAVAVRNGISGAEMDRFSDCFDLLP